MVIMGCHTWTYKKIPITPEYIEQLKKAILKDYNYYINKEYLKKFDEKEDLVMFDSYRDYLIDLDVPAKVALGDINTLMELNCDWKVYNFDGEWYTTKGTPHDPFRVYGYPEGYWRDADSLIAFLKDYDQELIVDRKGNKGLSPEIESIIRKLFETVDIISFG